MPNAKTMNWTNLLTTKRCSGKGEGADARSEFQRDVDRILFCDPFRRLARKSQVHPLNQDDHIHSRLTHSLEVSSVGRSLGEKVGTWLEERGELPEGVQPHHLGQIVQAACLAHDIGNPPFGHSGEAAIKEWFKANLDTIDSLAGPYAHDFTKFDGNAMAVRIMLSTGFYSDGMDPTLPVLGALLKYPWGAGFDAGKDKFSYFQTEAGAVQSAALELGLPLVEEGRYARHPLAYLTEAADDICYRTIDLEDATEVGLLDEWFMYEQYAGALDLNDSTHARLKSQHFRQRNSYLRTKLIGNCVEESVAAFKDNYEVIMSGTFSYKSSLLEAASGKTCKAVHDGYDAISPKLFLSRRKAILELGAQNSIGALLAVILGEVASYCTEKNSQGKEKVKILIGKELIEQIPVDDPHCAYKVTMAAVDYVTGMSDHYATELCRKLMGLGF